MSNSDLTFSPRTLPAWLWVLLTVLIPIVVTGITQMSGVFQKGRELDIRMVELGVGILRAGPQETGVKGKGAREWAINIIEKYSGVGFTLDERNDLLNNALPVIITTAQPTTNEPSSGGWVAVGFLASKNPSDQNFVTLEGGLLPAMLVGQVIKAKAPINIRPSPADWNAVNFVLNAGQCLYVYETRTLQAGSQNQTWARGDVSNCSPSK